MHLRKKQNTLAILEAVDSLSLLAELDASKELEKAKPKEFSEEAQEELIPTRSWYNPRHLAFNVQKVKGTFRLLFNYLRSIYENEESKFYDPENQKGMQALMLLAMEAASNLEKYLHHFPEGKTFEKVIDWEEYKELQQFYLNVIAPKLQGQLEQVEQWQEEWGVGAEDEEVKAKTAQRGIDTIEGLREDRDYELFFIRQEDGRPFFTRSILRHMHLVEQFDGLIVNDLEEDPLAKVKYIRDRDFHLCAKDILRTAAPYIDDFYRMGMKYKDIELMALMNKALIALMMAANPRNLMQTSLGKSSWNYFFDFQLFLRSLLQSTEYRRIVEKSPPLSERLAHCILNLAHSLGIALYMRLPSIEDLRPIIRSLIEEGLASESISSLSRSPLTLWNILADEEQQMRDALKFSPYGPLHNAREVFLEKQQLKGFDPLLQGNLPCFLYSFSNEKINIGCLHLPSPTRQEVINKVEIVPEFELFLRALSSGKRNQRHLIFNVQDRTSQQEYARATALEELSKKKEYSGALHVVTLATGTDFYLQSGGYAHMDDADAFLQAFKDELEGGEACGFHFPMDVKKASWRDFIPETMELIHDVFFAGKAVLIHKNRLDFIDIFYLFFLLKVLEEFKPDTISFTSKDGIDSAAAMGAELFAFLRMMNHSGQWSEGENDLVRMLFYAPALLIRNRAIEAQYIKRALSALSIVNAELEAHFNKVVAACSKLFKLPFFEELHLRVST
ncbi:MAG TPA: hypothetical protein VGJ00_07920 [Rhabdochlamydiaceae bacterium]|jgi:hypothetical protein